MSSHFASVTGPPDLKTCGCLECHDLKAMPVDQTCMSPAMRVWVYAVYFGETGSSLSSFPRESRRPWGRFALVDCAPLGINLSRRGPTVATAPREPLVRTRIIPDSRSADSPRCNTHSAPPDPIFGKAITTGAPPRSLLFCRMKTFAPARLNGSTVCGHMQRGIDRVATAYSTRFKCWCRPTVESCFIGA